MGKTTILAVLLGIAGGAGVGLGLAWDRPAPEVKTVAPNHQTAAHALATVAGKLITAAEVDARIGSRLLRLRVEEHNLRRHALRGLIADALVQREAERRAVSVNELLQEEVEKKARPVVDEEASTVYESAEDRFLGVSQAEAVRTIRESMQRQRVSQRRDASTRELAVGDATTLYAITLTHHIGRSIT